MDLQDLLNMFPKSLILRYRILVWNLEEKYHMHQLGESLNYNILNHSPLNSELKTFDDAFSTNWDYVLFHKILTKAKISWAFKIMNEKSSEDLLTMAYNTIANRVLFSFLEKSLNVKRCEFNRKLHECLKSSFVYACKDSDDKIKFFILISELISMMNCGDFSAVRDNYNSNIEKIGLPSSLEDQCIDYKALIKFYRY